MQYLDLTDLGDDPEIILDSIILVEETIPDNSLFLNNMFNTIFQHKCSSIIYGSHHGEDRHAKVINWCLYKLSMIICKTNKPVIIVMLDMFTDRDIDKLNDYAALVGRTLYKY